jgi:hypothetical protein
MVKGTVTATPGHSSQDSKKLSKAQVNHEEVRPEAAVSPMGTKLLAGQAEAGRQGWSLGWLRLWGH